MSTGIEPLNQQDFKKRLAAALAQYPSKPQPEFHHLQDFLTEAHTLAAVLIPLYFYENEWYVLFTRRHADLPEHSGQVAFPGGRSDPVDDNAESTALRETQEEIGLKAEDVQILGRLRDYLTISNYIVTPIVGMIPWPYQLKPAAEEVSRVFSIPLSWLANPDNHTIQYRALPPPYEPVPVVFFNEYDGETLWGASAAFTLSLLAAIFPDQG